MSLLSIKITEILKTANYLGVHIPEQFNMGLKQKPLKENQLWKK